MAKSKSRGTVSTKHHFKSLFIVTVYALIVVSIIAIIAQLNNSQSNNPEAGRRKLKSKDYSTKIDNKYMSLPIGSKFVFEGQTPDGFERIEISISGKTKIVDGVQTLVYRDKVYLDGQLHEDTTDYLAQHKNGDVWYFGEDVKNYEDGQFVNTDGSWHAGENGAEAGILIKQNPTVGETYQQEFYEGVAEDRVEVLSLDETVTTPLGTFKGCLKTYDYTLIDPESKEHKYFCPSQVGLAVGHRVKIQHLVKDETFLLKELKPGKAFKNGDKRNNRDNDNDDDKNDTDD